MNVLSTKNIKQKINNLILSEIYLLDILEPIDNLILDGYGCYLNFEEELLNECVEKINNLKSKEDAEKLLIISNLVDNVLGEIEDEEDEKLSTQLTTALYHKTKKFTRREIYKNPFIKNMKFKEAYTSGKYTLDIVDTDKGELFYYDKEEIEGIIHMPAIGYCSEKFKFPCIRTGDTIYHFVNPQIINLYKDIIDEVSGKVLSLGLGIGYFEYMASLKENVSEIVVIENDQDLINIFNEKILPNFPNPEKIKIIKAEPCGYLRKVKNNEFDYCVIDTSANPEEIIANYLRIKQVEKKLSDIKFLYYEEDSILLDIQSFLLMEILNDIDPSSDMYDDNNSFIEDENVVKKLQYIYKDEIIVSENQLDKMLEIENIKKTIEQNI